jgi:hypothetical protein
MNRVAWRALGRCSGKIVAENRLPGFRNKLLGAVVGWRLEFGDRRQRRRVVVPVLLTAWWLAFSFDACHAVKDAWKFFDSGYRKSWLGR